MLYVPDKVMDRQGNRGPRVPSRVSQKKLLYLSWVREEEKAITANLKTGECTEFYGSW